MSIEAPQILVVQTRGEALRHPNDQRELRPVFERMFRRRELAQESIRLAVQRAGGRARVYDGGPVDDLSPAGMIALWDALPVAATLENTEHGGQAVATAWQQEVDTAAVLLSTLQVSGIEPGPSFAAEPLLPAPNLGRLHALQDTGSIMRGSMSAVVLRGIDRAREVTGDFGLLTDGLLFSPSERHLHQVGLIAARLGRFVPGLRPPDPQETIMIDTKET